MSETEKMESTFPKEKTITERNIMFSQPKTDVEKQEALEIVEDMFSYHVWSEEKQKVGEQVRKALAEAFNTIIQLVPPSPDRTTALRKLREARMDCNSAITHDGRY